MRYGRGASCPRGGRLSEEPWPRLATQARHPAVVFTRTARVGTAVFRQPSRQAWNRSLRVRCGPDPAVRPRVGPASLSPLHRGQQFHGFDKAVTALSWVIPWAHRPCGAGISERSRHLCQGNAANGAHRSPSHRRRPTVGIDVLSPPVAVERMIPASLSNWPNHPFTWMLDTLQVAPARSKHSTMALIASSLSGGTSSQKSTARSSSR